MLDTLLLPLKLPDHNQISKHEGLGNYAISKYYKFPTSFFYRYKLKMILNLMQGSNYRNILDYGAGPGIFTEELKKWGKVTSVDISDQISPFWKFDLIICSSVLEFTYLDHTCRLLKSILHPNGKLIVASPIESRLSKLYFNSINDSKVRHSHLEIQSAVSKQFKIERYEEWLRLYFALRARQS